MAKTSKFGFTNRTQLETKAQFPIAELDLLSNYAKREDEPDNCVLVNKTTPLDQAERIAYRCRTMKKVNTDIAIQNPAPVTDAIQYSIRVDELLRTTSDDGKIVDEPIVASLTIQQPLSSNMTTTVVLETVGRLLSACFTAGGYTRFDDLARGGMEPSTN